MFAELCPFENLGFLNLSARCVENYLCPFENLGFLNLSARCVENYLS